MPALRPIRSHASLRGVAALLVVAYHLQFGDGIRLGIEEITPFFRRGYLWVDCFFILSGFIISYVNGADRHTTFSFDEATNFLRGRLIRLYPLHLFCLCAFVAGAGILTEFADLIGGNAFYNWGEGSIVTIVAQALLVNVWSAQFEGWNVPSWSISAEIVAYALFPLLVSARVRGRRVSEATMIAGAAGFMAIVAASGGSLDIVSGPLAVCRCITGFMLGMLIYFHRERTAALAPSIVAALQFVAVALILVLLASGAGDPLIVPGFMLLIATTWQDRGPVPRLLVNRTSLWLGEISYSIYLTHVPLLGLSGFFWSRAISRLQIDPVLNRVLWMIFAIGLVIAISHLTFALVERPARQWLSRRWLGRRAPPIATSPAAP